MAMFPLRSKAEEAGQLLLTFPHSLINVSADLYNALAHATLRAMGERRVRMITHETLGEIEAEFRRWNPQTTVLVLPPRSTKVYLYLVVLDIEESRELWERAVIVKVLFPISSDTHIGWQAKNDKDLFLALLMDKARIMLGKVENGGIVLKVMLYGTDVPVECPNPDDRHGKAWRYFIRKGETL